MAEALAVASAAVGLVTAASHGIRCLSKEINCMQAAPEYLANVRRELQGIENIIQSVQVSLRFEVDQDNWVSQKERIISALQDCSKLCEGFYNEFPDLFKVDKLGIRDRARFAWAKDRVKALEADLNRCKATITLALSGANYFAACEHYKQLQAMAAHQRDHHGPSASEQAARIAQLEAELESAVTWIKNYEDEIACLQAQIRQRRINLQIGDVVTQSSQSLIGIHNPDGTEGELKVKIGNVNTEGSRNAIGYSKDVNLSGVFSSLLDDDKQYGGDRVN
ncbi:hypothetical protein K456DRAFT_1946367 [Colletotrichum gloeosporioides 23]|nr:hypothetical protein K456DRAFT_1946367 [Colletotrichum gloeosporioides 23]